MFEDNEELKKDQEGNIVLPLMVEDHHDESSSLFIPPDSELNNERYTVFGKTLEPNFTPTEEKDRMLNV